MQPGYRRTAPARGPASPHRGGRRRPRGRRESATRVGRAEVQRSAKREGACGDRDHARTRGCGDRTRSIVGAAVHDDRLHCPVGLLVRDQLEAPADAGRLVSSPDDHADVDCRHVLDSAAPVPFERAYHPPRDRSCSPRRGERGQPARSAMWAAVVGDIRHPDRPGAAGRAAADDLGVGFRAANAARDVRQRPRRQPVARDPWAWAMRCAAPTSCTATATACGWPPAC